MCLVFSPYAPRAAVEHEISEEFGVRSVGDVRVRMPGTSPYTSNGFSSGETEETLRQERDAEAPEEEEARMWRELENS
jgi:hypothetical protein